jgi:hypothetical protein
MKAFAVVKRAPIVLLLPLLLLTNGASSAEPGGSTAPRTIDLAGERVGAQPQAFSAVIGNWVIATDGDKKVLAVDGRKWKEGQASAGVADKARALYGERYAEFLDSVQSYAYFPLAVAASIEDFRGGEIRVRFKPLEGRIDQGAGIAFSLKPNGDYLTIRANALENNLVLWSVIHGKRKSVEWVRNTPTASQQWHELRVTVQGTEVTGYLDGKKYLTHKLGEPVSGRVGLWSKADSYVLFDGFEVSAAK